MAHTVKNLPAMRETWVQSLGWEDPVEEGMVTNSSILSWRIPTDRGAWQAMVHGVAESDTTEQLSIKQDYTDQITVEPQAPLSLGILQATPYWSGLPCSPPGHLPNSGIKPRSPALQEDSLPS